MEYQRATKLVQKEQSKIPSSLRHTLLNHVAVHPILELQRTIDNQAVLNLQGSQNTHSNESTQASREPRFGHDFSPTPIHSTKTAMPQTKLKVNQPGDIYEQEADQVAEQVMRMTDPKSPVADNESGAKDLLMQKQSKEPGVNSATQFPDVPPIVHTVLNSTGGQPLNTAIRAFMEPRFGHDFSGVRVHTDDTAAEAARTLHANAFTAGSHIVFREEQFAPDTSNGRRLLAHELTHVVQQTAGGLHTTGLIQRDQSTEEKVKQVISPNVQMREGAAKEVEEQLNKRIEKRKAEIQAMLDELGPDPKSKSSQNRAKALKKDLDKDLATIIKEPDSHYVNKALRKDIIESAQRVKSAELELKRAQEQWSKYDPIFAGTDVAKALGKDSLSADELKALIAKESSELTKNPPPKKGAKAGIAGIAQLGTAEEKRAGGKPGDRKVPEKAIVLMAKTISLVAEDLDKLLSSKPTGKERKKFIMAAYNTGVNAIARAQQEAIKMGRDGTTWQSLIAGEEESPLFKAIVATYGKHTKDEYKKIFKEKSEYPDSIFKRLP